MTAIFIGACVLLGLLLGSFANVCVHRIPKGESVVFPGSHCPACGQGIAWYDNLPLCSYLWLRGRCRHCHTPIAIRYPLLEFLMGASWGVLAWHFELTPQLVMSLALVSLLWVLTFIDLETGLLPDAITLPGIAIGLLLSFWTGNPLDSLIGAIAGYSLFWLVARAFLFVTGREGMGYGDFKLLAMLGAFFGWQALPFIVFVSAFSGAIIGGAYLLLSRRHMRAEIPFGPYLAIAGMLWLLWGHEIWQWYLSLARI
ncbi:MAG: prepilin peptidase [Mariprofundaceae bacterium]